MSGVYSEADNVLSSSLTFTASEGGGGIRPYGAKKSFGRARGSEAAMFFSVDGWNLVGLPDASAKAGAVEDDATLNSSTAADDT